MTFRPLRGALIKQAPEGLLFSVDEVNMEEAHTVGS